MFLLSRLVFYTKQTVDIFISNISRNSFVFGTPKVARYSLSGSTPSKCEHKLCYHKQRFGKIAITVVFGKDEALLLSGLQ